MTAEHNGIKIEGTPEEMAKMLDSIQNVWIDLAKIPSMFGVDEPERLKKWLDYANNGLYIIDSTQCG